VDLLSLWLGSPEPGQTALAVDASALAGLTLLWGPPAQVDVLPDAATVAAALEPNPARLGILPFDQLTPEVAALAMSGQDPTNNDFVADEYPLAVRFYLNRARQRCARDAAGGRGAPGRRGRGRRADQPRPQTS
jgi:hypothetical protein